MNPLPNNTLHPNFPRPERPSSSKPMPFEQREYINKISLSFLSAAIAKVAKPTEIHPAQEFYKTDPIVAQMASTVVATAEPQAEQDKRVLDDAEKQTWSPQELDELNAMVKNLAVQSPVDLRNDFGQAVDQPTHRDPSAQETNQVFDEIIAANYHRVPDSNVLGVTTFSDETGQRVSDQTSMRADKEQFGRAA